MIGVIGSGDHALREAIFLKAFSPRVTILPDSREQLSDEFRADARVAGVAICDQIERIVSGSNGYEVLLHDGSSIAFDVIYPALGCEVRSQLAGGLEVLFDAQGPIRTDPHPQTNTLGIYAAGDVVHSLNQIAVAFGLAATAATAIHNSLRK